MAIERTYNIPLRKDYRRAPRYKRAKKAVSALRIFLMKHMKSDDVRIGKALNLKLWEHGIKNPPHHVKVNVIKQDDGVVKAELFGAVPEVKRVNKRDKDAKKKEEKKEIKPVKEKAEISEKLETAKEEKETTEKKPRPKKKKEE